MCQHLQPYYLKCVIPGSAESVYFGILLEIQIPGCHLRPTKTVSLGVGSRNLYFIKPLKWFWCTVRSTNQEYHLFPHYIVWCISPHFLPQKNCLISFLVTSLFAHCAVLLISFSISSFMETLNCLQTTTGGRVYRHIQSQLISYQNLWTETRKQRTVFGNP